MAQGRFHPVTHCKLVAGLDDRAKSPVCTCASPGNRSWPRSPRRPFATQGPGGVSGPQPAWPGGLDRLYLPALRVDHAMRNPHVPAGFWRGEPQPEHHLSRVLHRRDRPQHRAGPLALRRKLMAKARSIWRYSTRLKPGSATTNQPAGVFRGIAQTMALAPTLPPLPRCRSAKGGELKIHRIVAGTDCGNAVNPQQIQAQVGDLSFMVSPQRCIRNAR